MTVTAVLFVTEGFSLGGFHFLTAVTPAPPTTDGSRPASAGTRRRTRAAEVLQKSGSRWSPPPGRLGALVRRRLFLSSWSAAALPHPSGAWRAALSV